MPKKSPEVSNWELDSQSGPAPEKLTPEKSFPQKPVKKSGSNNTMSILLAFILGGLLIGGGILVGLYLVNREKTGVEENQATSGANKNESSSSGGLNNLIEETTGWKTYTNETMGFSVKYPGSLDIKELEGTSGGGKTVWFSDSIENSDLGIYEYSISAGSSPMAGGLSRTDEKSQVVVDGVSVDLETRTSCLEAMNNWDVCNQRLEDGNYDVIYLFASFKNNAKYWYISTGSWNKGEKNISEEKSKFNQILSTFKFLDETAEWKTYTNDVYGYQIDWPESWTEVEHSSNSQNVTSFKAADDSQLEIRVTEGITTSLSDYLVDLDETNSTGWEGQASTEVISTEAMTVSSYQGIEREEEWLAAGFRTKVTYLLYNQKVFAFIALPYADETDLNSNEVVQKYDEILATFIVTDAEATSSCDTDLLKQAFATKYSKTVDEVNVTIETCVGDYAKGSVSFLGEIGGGWFLAAKVSDNWVIADDGNGTVSCELVEPYNFPEEIKAEMGDCYSDSGGIGIW